MKKDEAMKLSENAINELASALSSGKSEQLVNYLDAMSSFHNYSFGNCMMICRQCPTATRVAGFKTWKRLGRQVRKGEKGICILAPLVGKCDDDEEGYKVFGFRAVHVFDVAQTDGEELPDLAHAEGDPGERLERLKAFVTARDIALAYKDDLGGALGVSKGGTICLLNGLSPAEEYCTLAHEASHEILHRGKERLTLSKVVKELEAEAVAYVVAKAAGLENALSQSADYIQLYSGDKEQLMKSLERVQRTASLILTGLESTEPQNLQEVA